MSAFVPRWVAIATPDQVRKYDLVPSGPMTQGTCFLCHARGEYGIAAAEAVAAGAQLVCYDCAPRAIQLRHAQHGPAPLASFNVYGKPTHPEMTPAALVARARSGAEGN